MAGLTPTQLLRLRSAADGHLQVREIRDSSGVTVHPYWDMSDGAWRSVDPRPVRRLRHLGLLVEGEHGQLVPTEAGRLALSERLWHVATIDTGVTGSFRALEDAAVAALNTYVGKVPRRRIRAGLYQIGGHYLVRGDQLAAEKWSLPTGSEDDE